MRVCSELPLIYIFSIKTDYYGKQKRFEKGYYIHC